MLKRAALVIVAALVVGQAIRPNRTNPPVDPTQTLAATLHPPATIMANLDRGCRDCHSSDTVWPWYTSVSPLSWWIVHHVDEGRREVSFSEWGTLDVRRQFKKLGDICEQVEKGDMPIESYLLIHREARLDDEERRQICDWTKSEQTKLGPLPPPSPEELSRRGRQGRRRWIRS